MIWRTRKVDTPSRDARLTRLLRLGLAAVVGGIALAGRAAEVAIALSAAPGLRFEPARFVVEPGANVTLTFRNPDEMMHNVVIVQPGARLAVAEAALALGEQGPARNFVPATDRVLWATPIVNPGGSARLTFTAPAAEGVYPYLCTFPGHGLIMFGAMYVARSPKLPPLADDPNLPPPIVVATAAAVTHPTLVRTFLPDCGPAAIAIGLPGGQSYCFDAVECRLRYAWRGGFIDNSPQWLGKGDMWARVTGRIYYRATPAARLRVGDASRPPVAKWLGHRLVDGFPRLNYQLDGAEVTEAPRVSPDGRGLEITYDVTNANGPVTFVADADGGASVAASAGTWSGSRLTLTPAEARHFALTFTERPGVEPLAYWSMDDLIFSGRKDPLPGVVGRAFTPGGNINRREILDSGVKLGALVHAGTLMSWFKLEAAPAGAKAVRASAGPPPVFSAGEGERAFVISPPGRAPGWHHLSAVLLHGTMALYVDGKEQGRAPVALADPEATIRIGSVGKERFLTGLLDEVRIYDRALDAAEIDRIFQREKPSSAEAASTR